MLSASFLACPISSAVCGCPRGIHPADICEVISDSLAQKSSGGRCVPVTSVQSFPTGGRDPEPRAERQVLLSGTPNARGSKGVVLSVSFAVLRVLEGPLMLHPYSSQSGCEWACSSEVAEHGLTHGSCLCAPQRLASSTWGNFWSMLAQQTVCCHQILVSK